MVMWAISKSHLDNANTEVKDRCNLTAQRKRIDLVENSRLPGLPEQVGQVCQVDKSRLNNSRHIAEEKLIICAHNTKKNKQQQQQKHYKNSFKA